MSDVVRRRIAALLLVAGAVVVALAIADVGPFEDPVTEEERVTEAVEEFFAAESGGDGEAFCETLTRDLRKELGVTLAQQLRPTSRSTARKRSRCSSLVFKGSSTEVRSVSVSGPRARVETRFDTREGPGEAAHGDAR